MYLLTHSFHPPSYCLCYQFLDSLASQSLIGFDHHSGASVCSPSRAALLTGRLGARTGVWQNFPSVAQAGLPLNETTLGEYFKQAAYTTAIHGKWHLGTTPPYHPVFRGFDEYVGVPFSLDNGCTDNPGYNHPPVDVCPKDPPNGTMASGGMGGERYGLSGGGSLPLHYENDHERPGDADLSIAVPLYQCLTPRCEDKDGDCNRNIIEQPVNLTTLSDHYIDSDRRFIHSALRSNTPFFLYVPLSHMHVPHATAPRWVGSSAESSVYGDTLRELDWHMNRTYNVLVEAGVVNETLFIFTSDNGPWSAKCGLAGNQGPFAGAWQALPAPYGGGGGGSAKFTSLQTTEHNTLVPWSAVMRPLQVCSRLSISLACCVCVFVCVAWEAGHRVPFLAHWPGRIKPRRTTALTSNLDLLPTLLSLTNVSLPTDRSFDGLDIAAVLFDGSDTAHPHLFHQDQNGTLTALRMGHLKAYYQSYSAMDGACGGTTSPVLDHYPPLVFNLSVDLAESRPIQVGAEELKAMDELLAAKRADIEKTARSVANYRSGDLDQRPCCDAGHIVCRCNQ